MSRLGYHQNSSRPGKLTEWKLRRRDNTWISFGECQIQYLEKQSVNQGEMEGDEGYPDIEGKMLHGGLDFETFHYFSKFPQEVQDIIWCYCCNIRRRVEVIDEKAKLSVPGERKLAFVSRTPRVPPLLHTCRAARHIGLRKYLELPKSGEPPTSAELPTSAEIYFNPEVDVICFGYRCFAGCNTIKWLEKNTYIQYIECRIELWRLYADNWARQLFNALRQFDNLRKVTFFYEAVDPEAMFGPILKKGFEDIVKVEKRWRVPKVKYVDRKRTVSRYTTLQAGP